MKYQCPEIRTRSFNLEISSFSLVLRYLVSSSLTLGILATHYNFLTGLSYRFIGCVKLCPLFSSFSGNEVCVDSLTELIGIDFVFLISLEIGCDECQAEVFFKVIDEFSNQI